MTPKSPDETSDLLSLLGGTESLCALSVLLKQSLQPRATKMQAEHSGMVCVGTASQSSPVAAISDFFSACLKKQQQSTGTAKAVCPHLITKSCSPSKRHF